MPSLVDSSVFIPVLPLLSAFLIGGLLISFNRTMNRLTKPVSFLIINSTAFSTIYATFLYFKHVSRDFSFRPLGSLSIDYRLVFNLNDFTEASSSIIGALTLLLMIFSFLKLPRSKGYVSYMASLSFIIGIVFFMILSFEFFKSFI